jgi:hypothetical protein
MHVRRGGSLPTKRPEQDCEGFTICVRQWHPGAAMPFVSKEAQKALSLGEAPVAAVAVVAVLTVDASLAGGVAVAVAPEAPGVASDTGDSSVAAADGGAPDDVAGFEHAHTRTTKAKKKAGMDAFMRGAPARYTRISAFSISPPHHFGELEPISRSEPRRFSDRT